MPPRSRTPGVLLLATFLSLLLLSAATSTAPPRQPAKRQYDSHVYYVLELDGNGERSPQEIALALGAEHVEQVGELQHHYLIRASKEVVRRGDGEIEGLSRRSNDGERDSVLERYGRLRRRTARAVIQKRDDIIGSIVALDRQYLRKRAKRQFTVPPPTLYGSGYQRRTHSLRSPVDPAKRLIIEMDPALVTEMARRFEIEDPIFNRQWHLVNGIMPENSINVTGVWEQGIFGQGVNVAIVDDGLDMHSDDLAPNFFAEGSWDYNDNTALPEPRLSDDQHGTRCAGEIAASKNDVCGVGIAHKAGIAGIRILSGPISDADEAAGLNYGFQSNAIYSCSWGPPDDGRSMEAPGALIVKAMMNGVQNGRGGKGSVYVFASGNGGSHDDQCNFDGYTNSLMSITVGALDRKGLHPYYSEACAANMIVTYSSGSGDNIHTTDVGKNVCSHNHGGTSAAAPIAAGVFALVLETRPELTWRDVQHLCVTTAVQINPLDPDWQMTASGRYFNHKYGYGKLDAWAIVEAAKKHVLVKPQSWWESAVVKSGERVTTEGTTSTISVNPQDLLDHNLEKIEHVTIMVNIDHQRRGHVEVELDSPRGMKSILARQRMLDDATTGFNNWVFMTVKHWDEDPVGNWTIRVKDQGTKNGTFNDWSMQLWGSAIDAAKAVPWKLPHESTTPINSPDTNGTTTLALPASTTASRRPLPTKTLVRPTEHLPDDHAEAPGEAHSTIGIYPSSTIAAALPTATPTAPESSTGEPISQEDDEVDLGYLAGMKALVGNSSWMFVAGGTIVVFIGAVTAAFLMRKSVRRGAGYDFAPTDEDELPMAALSRGGVRLGGGAGGNRTRDLYDAFALPDSDEESDSDEEVRSKSPRVKADVSYSDRAMENFLDEPDQVEDEERDVGPVVDDEETALVDQEREARERFSD